MATATEEFERQQCQFKRERAERVNAVTHPRLEARMAAKWWANTLRQPTGVDVGDGFLNFMIDAHRTIDLSPRLIDGFEVELAAGIEAEINEREQRYVRIADYDWSVVVGTDYSPDNTLTDAADRAGISLGMSLPPKTNMWVNFGRVQVRAGYGADQETVWLSPVGLVHWSNRAINRCIVDLRQLTNGIDITSTTECKLGNVIDYTAIALRERNHFIAELYRNTCCDELEKVCDRFGWDMVRRFGISTDMKTNI